MKTYRSKFLAGVLAMGVGVLAAPVALTAQSAAASPVFIALPESFPDVDARAVLMLEPGRDIVLLRQDDASPETLDVALGVLRRMYRDHPRPQDQGQLVPITGFVQRAPLSPERREALQDALSELLESPLANVGNLGLGRWIRFR